MNCPRCKLPVAFKVSDIKPTDCQCWSKGPPDARAPGEGPIARGVVGVTLRACCPSCEGARRVPGGDRKNGEMVNCHHCDGVGTIEQHMPLDTFISMMRDRLGGKP
jgi:hypothetical protein